MAYDPSRASPVKEPKAQSDITLDALLDEFEVSDPAVRDRVLRLAGVESSENLNATGPRVNGGMHNGTRARGALQIMPATAKAYPQYDLNDPADASRAGLHYFLDNLNQFGGDLDAATIAHHAGPGTAKKWLREGRAGTVDRATGLSTDDYLLKVTGGKRAKPADKWWESDPVAPAEAAGNWWESDPVEPAEAPGLLERGWSALKDTFSAPSGEPAAVRPHPGEKAPVAAKPDSVMADYAGEQSAQQTPANAQARAFVQQQYDAHPEKREAMLSRPDWLGDIARQIDAEYQAMNPAESLKPFDQRREAKLERNRAQGMDPATAEMTTASQMIGGEAPVGSIKASDFDFDLKQRYEGANPALRGAVKGYEGYKQGVLGFLQAGADLVGADFASGQFRQGAREAAGQAAAIGEGEAGARLFEGAVASLTQQLPLLIGGSIAGGQALILSGMAAQAFGQEYSEGRQAGLDGQDAATRASLFAAFEVIGEKFGMGNQLAALKMAYKGVPTKQLVAELGAALAKEIPGEVLTTTGQFLTDKAPQIGLKPEAGMAQYLSQVADTIGQTIIQGGLMMGGASAVSRGARAMQRPEPDLTAGVQFDPRVNDALARQALDPSNAQETADVAPPLDAASYQGPGADPAGSAGLAPDGRVGAGGTGGATGAPARSGEPGVSVGESERQQVAGVVEQKVVEKEAEAIASGDPIELLVTRAEGAAMRRAVTPQPANGIDIDQDALLADVEAMFTDGGNLMVQGDNAREAVKRIDPKALASALPRGDGALLVPKRFAGPVMDALQGAKQRVSVAFGGDGMMQAPDVAQFRATAPTQEEVQDVPKAEQVDSKAQEARGQEGAIEGFATRGTEILAELGRRGSTGALYKAAGVRTADAFADLPVSEKDRAYLSMIAGGERPVEHTESYNDKVMREEREILSRQMQGKRSIRQQNGKPFKTEASADQVRKQFSLEGTHTVEKVDGGFELRLMTPAAQAEARRIAEGRESYMEARDAVLREMGIGEDADGEIDATDAQWDEIDRRVEARMRGAQPTQTPTAPEQSRPSQRSESAQPDTADQFRDATKMIAPKPKNLLQLVRQAGGVSTSRIADITGDRKRPGAVGVFTRNGMDLDGLAELLQQHGFMTEQDVTDTTSGAERATELLRQALAGERPASLDDIDAEIALREEKKYRDRIRQRASELGIRTTARRFDDIEADVLSQEEQLALAPEDRSAFALDLGGYNEQTPAVQSFLDDAFDPFSEAAESQSTEDAMRALGFTEEEINAELQAGASPQEAGEADARGTEGRVASADARQADQGQGQQEGLTLDTYTPADIAQREADQTARAEDDAKAERDAAAKQRQAEERAEVRRRSEAAADTFELGMDPMENLTGQSGLFGQAEPAPQPARTAAPAASANTIFTEDAAEKARALLRRKLGQLNSGIDPEMLQAGITLAGYHIEKGARTFAAYARAMLGDLGEAVRPYLKSWYVAIAFDPRARGFEGMDNIADVQAADENADFTGMAQQEQGNGTDERGDNGVEPDRRDAETQDGMGAEGLRDGAAGDAGGRGRGVPGAQGDGGARRGSELPGREAAPARERGDLTIYTGATDVPGGAARSDLDRRSADPGLDGAPVEPDAAKAVEDAARGGSRLAATKAAQAEADATPHGNSLEDVRAALPALLPGQQEDVFKAEQRFAKPDGYGMLFTNGTGTGKAQPLDAKLMTPTGWKLMGEIRPGDQVMGVDGKPTNVLAVYPQGEKPIFRVTFSDGATTECCDEHLWETQTLYARRKAHTNPEWACAKPKVRSLAEIRGSIQAQHFVPVAAALELQPVTVAIPPYIMGALLGDGCITQNTITFASADPEIADRVAHDLPAGMSLRLREDGKRCPQYRISLDEQLRRENGQMEQHPWLRVLRAMGLHGCDSAAKFVPDEYLRGSIQQRTEILQGLLDTDGWVDAKSKSPYFTSVSRKLADAVAFLARSLGGTATVNTKRTTYRHFGEKRVGQPAFSVSINLPPGVAPFALARKAALYQPNTKYPPRRKIVAVEPVGSKPAQCIAVDHPRHLYVTDDCIVTHNTFTGLGIVKRFALAGKTNILIVAPNDKIIEDWQKSGRVLGLDIARLQDTNDAGAGIVITTYANFGDNAALASREWDLVVSDESHYLMQDKDGTPTSYLRALRAITLHPDGVYRRHEMLNGDELAERNRLAADAKMLRTSDDERQWAQAEKVQDKADALSRKLEEKFRALEADVKARQGAARPRAVFLSATPFAYEKTIDWANGYLFDYNESQPSEAGSFRGYNDGSNRDRFFMQHLGYRMRYNKLTQPDAKVDSGLMQRQFNGWLKKKGSLSGRMLDVPFDYDRRFILVDSAIGTRIDAALTWLREEGGRIAEAGGDRRGVDALKFAIDEKFDYLSRRYLLEAIKAAEVIPHVREHLALGRKVVVFHDYKKGGGFNPFVQRRLNEGGDDADAAAARKAYNAALDAFNQQFADLIGSDIAKMPNPIEAFQRAFPDVLLFNGNVPKQQRRASVAKFQDDASGPQVILVQSAAGKEGISLHDTTGKYQRVLFNLGQPTQPTTAIQQEGRIYRTGQQSDAIIRYLNTGTNWEKWAFASTIAQRASAAENLGAGEQARALKDAFIQGFEESDAYRAGMEGEGKGGKERDRLANEAISEYDRAKAYYFGQQKKTSKTKAQEGADYFATPEPVGLKMVEWADIRPGERVLEPSAGHGAIARWMPENAERTAIEPSSPLLPRLAMVFDGKIQDTTFEALNVVNKFDAIVMNPPFGSGGKTAIEHVAKAATHLREKGRIVALIPTGPAADKRFEKWFYETEERPVRPIVQHDFGTGSIAIYRGDTVRSRAAWAPEAVVMRKSEAGGLWVKVAGTPGETQITLQSLTGHTNTGPRTETVRPAEGLHLIADIKMPGVTFERAGTRVATRVVVIEKQSDPAVAQNLAERQRDYTGVEDIGELFDRLEDLMLPKRTGVVEADAAPAGRAEQASDKSKPKAANPDAVGTVERQGLPIVEHTTAKGKVIRGVIRTDLSKEQAQKIDPYTWKKDGGYFIREQYLKPEGDAPAMSRASGQEAVPAMTRSTLVQSISARFPSLTRAVESALRRGDEGKPGGVVVVERAEDLARTFAEKTGRAMDDAVRLLGSDDNGSINGFYDPKSKLTFLVAPSLTERTAPAVLLHEATHAKQREDIDRRALALIEARDKAVKPVRDFLNRVAARMESAGEAGVYAEAAAYIVEEAALAGRKAGFSAADGKLLNWIDVKFGKRVGDIVRDFAAMVRAWMMRSGVMLNPSIDDLVALAKLNVRDMGRGNVEGGGGFSRASQTASEAFKKWFGNSRVVDENGAPLVVYHGSPTPNELTEFRPGGGVGSRLSGDAYGVASYFTSDPGEASTYARDESGAVMPVYIRGEILDLNGELTRDQRERLTRLANETLLPSDKARFDVGRKRRTFDSREDAIAFFDSQRKNWTAFGDGMDRARPDAIVEGDKFIVEYTDFDAEVSIETGDQAATLFKAIGWDNLPAAGFDGMMMNRSGGAKWVVMHRPSGNVKSATGNAGTFDPANPDIRFSRTATLNAHATAAQPAQAAPRAQQAQATAPEETRFQAFQRKAQDKLNRFTVIKEWLAEQGVVLSEQADVYKAEERMHSRFANKAEDFREKTVKPLVEKIQKAGYSMDDVAQFLHAQHAEERNIQIASINPQMPDGGSGMKTADANAILAAAPVELKRLANEFRAITERTKQILLDNGIISQDMADAWDATYQHYVPLKGGPEQGGKGAGKGLKANYKGKRALGHTMREEGEWIVENILADHERAIMLAEKNRVGQSLLKMAIEVGRDDLLTVGKPEKRGVLKNNTAYEVLFKGKVIGAFQSLEAARTFRAMAPAAMKGASPSEFGIRKVSDPTVAYMASPMLADNEVNVYVKGQAIRVQINDDLLARAYGNMGTEALGAILRVGATINGYFSKIYTGYNPEFILTNIVRDFTTGVANVTGEEGAMMALRAAKDYPASFADLFRYATTGSASQWIRMYREDGGNTGAAYLSDLERLGDEISTEYAAYKGVLANLKVGDVKSAARAAGRKAFDKTLVWVERINQAGENAMRLSIYKAMIESGKSRAEAASLAKNATVNFNRNGEVGRQMNALWLFYNAGAQGTAAIAHANLKGRHKWQARAVSAGILGLGYTMAVALGAGDDEDDYDKLSDYTKARNVVIKTGDGWLKIPVPYGYGLFWNMGRAIADAERKGEWGKAPWHVASSFIEEFTPFGAAFAGDDLTLEQVTLGALPTLAQIPASVGMNRTTMGGPMYPESAFDKYQPDNEKMWRATKGTIPDMIAQALDQGGIEVSPETIKYLTRTFTGGAGQFVTSIGDAAWLTANGASLEVKEQPFVRKFYTETDVREARSAYYAAVAEAEKAVREGKSLLKMGDHAAYGAYRVENQEFYALDRMAKARAAAIKARRNYADAIRADKSLSVKEKRDRLKAAEAKEQVIYDRYLEVFKSRTRH